jgi:hypothetical protein
MVDIKNHRTSAKTEEERGKKEWRPPTNNKLIYTSVAFL